MTPRNFGAFFRACRIRQGLTLRAFCRANSYDAANISRLERGEMAPTSSREKLEQYARTLNLESGSDEWFEFLDLAAAATGKIPADLADDKELLDKLPLVFRTLRGEKVSGKKLKELIERIRKA